MQDIFTRLSTLNRPRLLVSAARHGLTEYDRAKHLRKILGIGHLPGPGEAAMRLFEIEQGHNEARKAGDGTYALARHIDVLIALMAEARALQARAAQGPRLVTPATIPQLGA